MELDVLDPPDAVGGAVSVRDLSPGIAAKGRLEMRPGVAGMEGEDGREVVPGCSRQPEPVLLRPGLGALVWPDPLAIGSELDPGQEPAASESRAVRSAVVLLERPDGRLGVPGQDALVGPLAQKLGGVLVGVAAVRIARQVELDDVVGRADGELGTLDLVDHVVGGSDDVGGRDLAEVVVHRLKGKDLCHGDDTLDSWRSGRGATW